MREKIIDIILENDSEFISGEEIAKVLGISRSAVWKHIKVLKEQGYNIESINKKGYRLAEKPTDLLNSHNIGYKLGTEFIGKNILYFETLNSTNTYAKKIAQDDIDGTVIISEEQTSGRGRLGRAWSSNAYEGIWMSIVLKPSILPYKTPFLTIITAMSIAKALDKLGVKIGIKWPNDIILNGKKLCGILTELSAEIDRVNYVVLGIGMNVKTLEFDKDIENIATSLYKEGYKISRADIVKEILEELEKNYLEYVKYNNKEYILEGYRRHSVILGKKVYIIKDNNRELVECIDINMDGNLIVKKSNGKLEEILSGEISIRGEKGYV